MAGVEDTRFRRLLDAEQRHRAAPDSFSIPRSDVRSSLQTGTLVKLLFGFGDEDVPSAERMWVEILDVHDGRYVGRLENEPQAISDLRLGARIEFGPEHVAAVIRDTGYAPRGEQFAIVSDRIWAAGAPPARAIRLPVPDDQFSGWVLAAASDPIPPPDDLSGYGAVSHADLLTRYRAFDSVDDESPGTRWRWDVERLEWRHEDGVGSAE
jgi:uncharacterized protein YegJ (DUF2314 family)